MTGPMMVTLEPVRVTNLQDLIVDITGKPLDGLPWFAAAMLYSAPTIQSRLRMPEPGPEEVLIHDYQSVTVHSELPRGVDLAAQVVRREKGMTTEFDFSLSDGRAPAVVLKTALRIVPRADIRALTPVHFSQEQIRETATRSPKLTISQAQISAYVDLSVDRNPIHSDPAEARSLGLAAPIVPGLVLAATVQPFARLALGSIKCRFMAPLCADETYEIALIPRSSGRMRAFLYRSDRRGLAIADLQGNFLRSD